MRVAKRNRQHFPLAIILLLLFALLTPHAHANGRADEVAAERFARLFGNSEWQPESSVPTEPQAAPGMLIWELTRHLDGDQTPEQKQRAEDLIERSYRAAEKNGWFKFEQSVRDDFFGLYADELHYANEEYILDDAILDPERPEFLMYMTNADGVKQLVGIMFLARTPLEQGPQIGGAQTIWHYHVWASKFCLLEGLLVLGLPDESEVCYRGKPSSRSAEMIHVWLVDHPDGPFATNMSVDRKLVPALLERRLKERGF